MTVESTPYGLPSPIINSSRFVFELEGGGDGIRKINEPLLKTQTLAELRAKREFLKSGYTQRICTFKTYRSDIKLNDIISVKGLKYKVVQVQISSDDKKVIFSIKGVRYEQ